MLKRMSQEPAAAPHARKSFRRLQVLFAMLFVALVWTLDEHGFLPHETVAASI